MQPCIVKQRHGAVHSAPSRPPAIPLVQTIENLSFPHPLLPPIVRCLPQGRRAAGTRRALARHAGRPSAAPGSVRHAAVRRQSHQEQKASGHYCSTKRWGPRAAAAGQSRASGAAPAHCIAAAHWRACHRCCPPCMSPPQNPPQASPPPTSDARAANGQMCKVQRMGVWENKLVFFPPETVRFHARAARDHTATLAPFVIEAAMLPSS